MTQAELTEKQLAWLRAHLPAFAELEAATLRVQQEIEKARKALREGECNPLL